MIRGVKIKDIAIEIGISESLVKKRIRQIQGKEVTRDKETGIKFTIIRNKDGKITVPEPQNSELLKFHKST